MHQFPNRIISQKAQNPPPSPVVPCCTYLALSLSLSGIGIGLDLGDDCMGKARSHFCSRAASLMILATSKVHFWSSDKESLPTSLKQHGHGKVYQNISEPLELVSIQRICLLCEEQITKQQKKAEASNFDLLRWQETGQSLASRPPFARSLSSFAGACLCRWTARIW